MTADVEMLPLPGELMDEMENMIGIAREAGFTVRAFYHAIRDYARAVAEYNVAPRDAEIEALRAEVERANSWNERVSVCRDHVADIVDGSCVICALDAAEARADKLRAEVEMLRDGLDYLRQMQGVPDVLELRAKAARAERLAEALRNSSDALERLAFAIRAPNAHTPQLVELAIAMRTAALAQQPAAVDRARFRKAPCYLCGYNGAGYFQPETHPCAALYHAAQHQEPKS